MASQNAVDAERACNPLSVVSTTAGNEDDTSSVYEIIVRPLPGGTEKMARLRQKLYRLIEESIHDLFAGQVVIHINDRTPQRIVRTESIRIE